MWELWQKAAASSFDPLREPVLVALPVFVLVVALEWGSQTWLERTGRVAASGDRPVVGAYATRDALTSIALGALSQGFWLVGKLLGFVLYVAVWLWAAPWRLPEDAWTTWLVVILGTDFLYYWYHRGAHRVRLLWATHQAHHSSEYYNFATALRQKWNNLGEVLTWLPLALVGVPPWMMFTGFAVSLVYQFFVHTERVRRLPAPIEFVFNTPSHHRVHHGSDPEYLDRNYGGILIVWDRLFGTFRAESRRPTYGLVHPVDTYDLWRLQIHEYAAIWRDVRAARCWRDRFGFAIGPPGWQPLHPSEL